jgi:predicted NodU family carbamoyl transferase
MATTKLISGTNSEKSRRIIRAAATEKFGRGKAELHWEHDQWWAILKGSGRTYAVVDVVSVRWGHAVDFERLD